VQIHLSRPDITEAEVQAVCDVLRSPDLSLGPKLTEFENSFAEFIGTTRAVAVNSGTSGLFLCLRALGLGAGDEVITTPFTFIASTTSIMMTGAKPVFVDIDKNCLNLDPERIESVITSRTKAILPVAVFGNLWGFDTIKHIAEAHGLKIIEDSCEALGSELCQQKAGTFGDMSVFAFYPNKQITTGEGGMILTNDNDCADLCVSLRNQGRGPGSSWLSHRRLGYNFRLSEINCALGIIQLSRIEEIMQKRARVAQWYQTRLIPDNRIITPAIPATCKMSWFVYVVRLRHRFSQAQRDELLKELNHLGIQASNYFPPVHLQPFLVEQYGYTPGAFPITESVSQRTIALPFHNNLTEEEVDIVCNALKQALSRIEQHQLAHRGACV
jgi:perosamine synthetase